MASSCVSDSGLYLPSGWESWKPERKEDLRNTLRMAKFRRLYTNDVEAFLHDCFRWQEIPRETGPTGYQIEILSGVYEHGREAARGPHGIGKTTIGAWFILHFALTRDGISDWKLPSTASAWRQLREYLWPEVHKWARLLDWSVIGREPFEEPRELQDMALRLSTGNAFAVASDQPASIEGAHADSLAYLYDEAKTIPAETFEASEGAFSGAGADTGREAFALGMSTPGPPAGPFYMIHKKDPRYSGWHPRHVTLEEAITAGRVSRDWAEEKAEQWRIESALYQNRVLGEFAAADEDAMIPLSWVEQAQERFRALELSNIDGTKLIPQEALNAIGFRNVGVDVADQGEDQTVLALRYGSVISELRRIPYNPDPMQTAGESVKVLRSRGGYAVVDGIGVGSGVVARLREQGFSVDSFIAGEGSDRLDATGEFGFINRRAEAWQGMRELLDPSQPGGSDVALPPDDQLTGDLTAPKGTVTSSGKLRVEDKESIRKRIGRSPDDGDAVVMSFNGREQREELSRPRRRITPSGPRSTVTR
jgi:hypothetical protein